MSELSPNEPITRREAAEALETVLTLISGTPGANQALVATTRANMRRIVLGEPLPTTPVRV